VVEAGGIAVTIEKAPCFSGRRWHEAYEACDGKGLAAALTSATGRQYRFLGESPADLMFDMPGEPLSILHLPIRADVTKLLFELAAKVVERDVARRPAGDDAAEPAQESCSNSRLSLVMSVSVAAGTLLSRDGNGRLVSFKPPGVPFAVATADFAEGETVEVELKTGHARRIVAHRSRPLSEKAKAFPSRWAVVGEQLFHGNVIDYADDGRLVQWKGGGRFLGCAGEDLSEGDVVEMRRMLWYRVKPEAENPIER
jgi:hypothetical protein